MIQRYALLPDETYITKDTHYLNMIDSTMVGVRYNTFASKKEHKILQISISNNYALSKKLAVMHLCLSTLESGIQTFIHIYIHTFI